MGYALGMGLCFCCRRVFGFNPVRVPSHQDEHGVKQPICETCMGLLNKKRREKGLQPFPILADAYEACEEHELG